jgi:hypothetical protein
MATLKGTAQDYSTHRDCRIEISKEAIYSSIMSRGSSTARTHFPAMQMTDDAGVFRSGY